MNTKSLLALAALAVTMGSVSSAVARSHDLVNQALDKTLDERARVERSYEEKIDRPEDDFREKGDERKIEVVMDGEIGGKGGGFRLKDSDRSDRAFRERDVDQKLAQEALEIDQSFRDEQRREERAQAKNVREKDVRVYGKRRRE